MPQVGEMAPDFELPNQDGKMVRLSDFRGKRVILFAYPKANTPGCTSQACGFRDSFPLYQDRDIVVLGISAGKPQDHLKWKQKEHLPYDLLSDENHEVLSQWGVGARRSSWAKSIWASPAHTGSSAPMGSSRTRRSALALPTA